ncbi:uncharacterized protein EDB91DRAFT_1349912 [Suillus paluster]|uniref:uncharacterized protein n=1 Tax=Suillus paluster TaxID=48578 RepID=UPI001B85B957|nr:uncharacterized protein EDB91DRAFT_1349912 [Suillus paluster]KAG1729076.1 hypothetical protein EDB91DRAFT_1349912 [Suillus paluster]
MQLLLLSSAFTSIVSLVAASPAPRAIVERSSLKREELDTNLFQHDESDSGEGKKREELGTNLVTYGGSGYVGGGGGSGIEKRGELETNLVDYYQREELETNLVEYY